MRKLFKGFFRYIAALTAVSVFFGGTVYAEEAIVIRRMEDNEKTVYLTFDDGPDTVYTKSVMDTLMKYNVQGTFFFTGVNMARYPSVVKELYDNGFTIGLHGYAHASFSKMSADGLRRDIDGTNNVLETITGERSKIVRPPYGAINNTVVKTLGDMGFKAYMWTIDPKDWSKSVSDSAFLNDIKRNLSPGAIILLHSSAAQERAARMLPGIIEYIKAQGYQMKALPDDGYKTVLADPSGSVIQINGRASQLEAYSVNGSNYVRLRGLAEALNGTEKRFNILWDEETKAINLIQGAAYNDLIAKQPLRPAPAAGRAMPFYAIIYKDGTQVNITSYSINGENYFNLRELAEVLNTELTFYEESNTIDFYAPMLPDYVFSRVSLRMFAFMSRLLGAAHTR